MGYLAIILVDAFLSIGLFQYAKRRWNIGTVANAVGAICLFAAIMSLQGWLITLADLTNSYNGMPLFAETPWYVWLVYLSFGFAIYILDGLLTRIFNSR